MSYLAALAPLSPAVSGKPLPTPLPATAQRAGCPSKCGDVDIPYRPFGIGEKCTWSGFTVKCNDSFSPPRPYTGKIDIIDILSLNYIMF
uniref:Wall-associated receptor kinase galacturonan-binding domain-containing protein n=1 Tax=Leersia perrieri TaxID=77586 RepID=A0A0D9XVJ7_9ORYZ